MGGRRGPGLVEVLQHSHEKWGRVSAGVSLALGYLEDGLYKREGLLSIEVEDREAAGCSLEVVMGSEEVLELVVWDKEEKGEGRV